LKGDGAVGGLIPDGFHDATTRRAGGSGGGSGRARGGGRRVRGHFASGSRWGRWSVRIELPLGNLVWFPWVSGRASPRRSSGGSTKPRAVGRADTPRLKASGGGGEPSGGGRPPFEVDPDATGSAGARLGDERPAYGGKMGADAGWCSPGGPQWRRVVTRIRLRREGIAAVVRALQTRGALNSLDTRALGL